jgi:phospholipid/cholesterol/gamma-HCH transport system substrate-binding protein
MKQQANIETWVGGFLLLGIALVCTLIIVFGELPDILKPSYSVTVNFQNASGLLKGSEVFLSGASIGKVTTNPQPIPDTQLVEVKLKIDNKIKIRKDAQFIIGSSGLLGDRFVEVRPKIYDKDTPDSDKQPYVPDGYGFEGAQDVGLEQIMSASKPLIDRANDIAAQLDDMITRLNKDVLSDTSTSDLKETIAKLRHMVDSGDSMITNANSLLVDAKTGKGVLGRLIYDKQTGDNFRDLVANLKAHGPIFYHDDTADKNDNNDSPPPRKKNK